MWLILFLCGFVLLFYYKVYLPQRYWKEKGVPYTKPWPIVGNFGSLILKKETFMDIMKRIFNQFPKTRYSGIHLFLRPALLVKDPELIKQICIKDFDHFVDHVSVIEDNKHSLIGKTLISLRGQDWKDMRGTLSPIFTGSKMKTMFNLMSNCADHLAEFYLQKNCDVIDIEMKDTFTRYTNDVIATTAFGIECDSLNEPNNEFYSMGNKFTNPSALQNFKTLLFVLLPFLSKLGLDLFPASMNNFFLELVTSNIKERESKGIIRPDLIHLLMEARKGKLKHEPEKDTPEFAAAETHKIETTGDKSKIELTDEMITAQAIIFFLAGFDTASTLSSFMAHELAAHSEVQNKLLQEIDDTIEECNGKVTYEALMKMQYLDQVISETLRLWPPAFQTDRKCVKDYVIKAKLPHEKDLLIEEGMQIIVPIMTIQRHYEYFPDPDSFDPDRFSPENRKNITPGTFIPFGVGPRNCIGSRFALLETKMVFFHLLSKFEFVVIDKTEMPMKLSPKKFQMAPENGFWLGLKKR